VYAVAPLLLAQGCCVALALVSAFGAYKTFREGLHLTDTLKVPGGAARILGAGTWLALGGGFLAIAFVLLPTRGP
jgi:hypothetical protein